MALRWSTFIIGNWKHDVLKALLRDIYRKYYKFSFNSDEKSPLPVIFLFILNALKID